jgi:glycosyltransferase involved in cell wall biosynthesis
MRTAVFSIIAPNRRAHARVLMASLRTHHPQWDRFVLLVGGTAPAAGAREESFTEVALEALKLPAPRQFCFRYSILELSTAVKPWMFEHLFAIGYDRVLFFDPDILVFSPLAELDTLSARAFVTLTPHLTEPTAERDDRPSERAILRSGTYNLGFLAVTRAAPLEAFIAWWRARLEFQCVVDIARGLFVDQRWMDFAPGLFPDVEILRHDGYNVAHWNIRQRAVVKTPDDLEVNGQPLRFFHFSGFDPALPHLLSRNDRLTATDIGDASTLTARYGEALNAADYRAFRDAPYLLGSFADGRAVHDVDRMAYRRSTSLQIACGDDPFAHPEQFRSPPAAPKLLERVASYPWPLVTRIPRPIRAALREVLSLKPLPPVREIPRKPVLAFGLNVIGYHARGTGVGESARLCRIACDREALPTHAIDVDSERLGDEQAAYRFSVYHVNADMLPEVRRQLPHVFEASTCNIGCWHWELPELPDGLMRSAEPLQEIWAPSSFIQSAVSRQTSVPVVHLPHGVEVTQIAPCSPVELGVPDRRFTFLCTFDFGSVVERKNPLAAVDAFSRAFPDSSSVALLIKVSGVAARQSEYAELVARLRGMRGIWISDRWLSRPHMNGLLAACDAIVSLHRSEGFGLVLAEAMYLGKPVIATGWSGNMDFMDATNSCPVGFDLTTLPRAHGGYPAGGQWAEPDIDHAATLMRQVVDDSDRRRVLGQRARRTILTRFSPEAAGRRYRRRLDVLSRELT